MASAAAAAAAAGGAAPAASAASAAAAPPHETKAGERLGDMRPAGLILGEAGEVTAGMSYTAVGYDFGGGGGAALAASSKKSPRGSSLLNCDVFVTRLGAVGSALTDVSRLSRAS